MAWSKHSGATFLAGLAVASLTGVGLAYSQQTPSRPASASTDAPEFISINEPGKAAQKAVVLKTYRTADGKSARDVKLLNTGEVITLYSGTSEPPAPPKTSSPDVARVPPPAPLPPGIAPPTPVTQYRSIQESGKPAMKCAVMAEWITADGVKACQLKAVDSGDIITVVQTGPVEGNAGGTKSMTTRIYHWGKDGKAPAGAPMPPAGALSTAKMPEVPPMPETSKKSATASKAAAGNAATEIIPPTMPKATTPTLLPGMPMPAAPVSGDKTTGPVTKNMPSSQVGTSDRPDPLSIPESYASPRTQEKAPALKEIKPSASSTPTTSLGAGSTLASGNGTYVPVPTVTVPKGNPPMPPMPQMPKPPTEGPNPTWYVNAFTPPLPPNAISETQMQQRQLVPMAPPGYPAMPMANGAMVGYQAMPYPQGGFVQMPMPGRGDVAMAYQGPMPPSPIVSQPAGMPMLTPAFVAVPMPPYRNQAMDRPGMAQSAPSMSEQAIMTLKTSIYPTQRETAVQQIAACEERSNQPVVQLLLRTAKEDPAPTVRASCVAGLSLMGVRNESMIQTCSQLKSDADPRVRQEADRALARMTSGTAQATDGR